jgi:hypothetical protein
VNGDENLGDHAIGVLHAADFADDVAVIVLDDLGFLFVQIGDGAADGRAAERPGADLRDIAQRIGRRRELAGLGVVARVNSIKDCRT